MDPAGAQEHLAEALRGHERAEVEVLRVIAVHGASHG